MPVPIFKYSSLEKLCQKNGYSDYFSVEEICFQSHRNFFPVSLTCFVETGCKVKRIY
jgi:hypothetical protein